MTGIKAEAVRRHYPYPAALAQEDRNLFAVVPTAAEGTLSAFADQMPDHLLNAA